MNIWARIERDTLKQGLTGCWVYAENLNMRYPTIYVGGGRGARKPALHVMSYERHHGPVPPGMDVRHSCHNPRCWQPRHLSVGTRMDNMQDMVQAGRQGAARKLTKAQVAEVRALLAAGKTQTEIAPMYGVTHSAIGYLARGKTYKGV